MSVPVLTAADVVARLPAKTYSTLFARDGGATPDAGFRDRMVAVTNSAIAVWTATAFPNGLVADGHTPDPIFVEWALDVLCFYAATKHANGGTAYKDGFELARKEFKALTRGADPAPVTSGTAPEPTGSAPAAAIVASPEGATTWADFASGEDS